MNQFAIITASFVATVNGSTPEEVLAMQQRMRRRDARYIEYVYRYPVIDGVEVELEIEVAIEANLYRAEPDVGIMTGGCEMGQWAQRIDNGEAILLTPDEIERFEISAMEDEADRKEQAMCEAAESREDW